MRGIPVAYDQRMKIQTSIDRADIVTAGAQAARAEQAGYDGLATVEALHDPFLPLVSAAAATERIQLTTGIAVAFARSPMTVAHTSYDLALLSKGRFVLGLGSQIKPHIEKRFDMPWSRPAARMRDYLLALKAIWSCWQDGTRLNYDGEFYRHTLTTPNFTPAAHEYGAPKLRIAAVGPKMTEVAGEVADGLMCHAFTTAQYLREVSAPGVRAGAERAGRNPAEVELMAAPMVAVLDDEERVPEILGAIRKKLAFYGSTPAYRPVLDLHGWGDLQDELRGMSLRGEWDAMADRITEEQLHTLAIVGTSTEVAQSLVEQYDGLCAWVSPYTPDVEVTDLVDRVVAEVRLLGATR